VRLWPIAIGATPAILLGPIAVDDRARSAGVGAGLIRRACEAAAKEGHQVVLLVGDEAYFGQFGFSARAARDVSLPGPVDQNRVLAKALTSGAAEGLSGRVRAAATTPGRPELARTMSVAA
jgi:predicted N-acetyltransferase YhbS